MKISKLSILIYGTALAAGALLLQWLDYQYTIKRFSTEITLVMIGTLFTAVGIWIGNRLTRKTSIKPFEKNTRALTALGISDREEQVLELLAEGHSNQEIADRLFISLNTVKTHLNHLYQKLEVSRRTQAIDKARSLHLIG